MVKLKRSPKNLELDINVAKNEQFHIFPWQAANSMANSKFRGAVWKSACCGIFLALVISCECGTKPLFSVVSDCISWCFHYIICVLLVMFLRFCADCLSSLFSVVWIYFGYMLIWVCLKLLNRWHLWSGLKCMVGPVLVVPDCAQLGLFSVSPLPNSSCYLRISHLRIIVRYCLQ